MFESVDGHRFESHPLLNSPRAFGSGELKNEGVRLVTTFSHYESMGIFPHAQGQLIHSPWSDLAEFQTHPSFNGCPCYLQ